MVERNEEGERQQALPSPPSHLFERLAQLPGYSWETNLEPFHSVSALILQIGQSADLIARLMTIGTFLGIGT